MGLGVHKTPSWLFAAATLGMTFLKLYNTSLVYLNTAGGGTAATVTKLTSILDGSYTPVADYLGCPAV